MQSERPKLEAQLCSRHPTSTAYHTNHLIYHLHSNCGQTSKNSLLCLAMFSLSKHSDYMSESAYRLLV